MARAFSIFGKTKRIAHFSFSHFTLNSESTYIDLNPLVVVLFPEATIGRQLHVQS